MRLATISGENLILRLLAINSNILIRLVLLATISSNVPIIQLPTTSSSLMLAAVAVVVEDVEDVVVEEIRGAVKVMDMRGTTMLKGIGERTDVTGDRGRP
jgi:uncharacterized membrane protein YccF (DUF307 family)